MTRVSQLWQSVYIPIICKSIFRIFLSYLKSLARALHIIERNALNKPLHNLTKLNNNKTKLNNNKKEYTKWERLLVLT